MMALSTEFKVIIVGGGPVGLLAAHAFFKAGIDFVVLERRDTVRSHQGSSIAIGPSTTRLFDQLGLFDATRRLNHKLGRRCAVTGKGMMFSDVEFSTWLTEFFGHELNFIHRSELLDMLYTTLPEEAKAKVLTNKRISDITSDEAKAVVTCEDDTSYQGSVVLGADGVHSQVREYMRTLALQQDPKAKVDEEKPFLSTYRCMFGYGPTPEGPKEAEQWECHTNDKCTQLFVGRDKTWFFVYEKMAKPTRERTTYSVKDKEQYAERLGDLLLHEKVRVRDVYKTAQETILVDLEEGTVKNFTWGRLLLAGDAANKQTPNAGNGFNNGAQDIAMLVNLLHGLVSQQNREKSEGVSMAALSKALGEYQAKRRKLGKELFERSALMTRMSTFDSWGLKMLDRYIVPGLKLDRFLFEKMVAPIVAASDIFTFLPENNLKQGKFPWKNTSAVQAAAA
ncbi:uncharacterized protein B0I36DRAFT_309847 [Microdochium trichocladiopsis]|uniref:FAD-binding domain-containing protein n=1 Tax=Microdochium trichocladiopsis TaxID=1682393 RepID=A0A9P9BZG0_9PEZI|nr:uncharacterized protein B0I36DRAFT_309847 [Microdochium trichocladiopsis]KAH7040064.1 hypothetical protein B0I36DRAFT_309847 [Microdochium trichocladiopsis]